MTPEESYDDATLLQKVRSEALGHFPGPRSVEVDVSDDVVPIDGSVPREEHRSELVEMIEDVEGVKAIEDRLEVSLSSR